MNGERSIPTTARVFTGRASVPAGTLLLTWLAVSSVATAEEWRPARLWAAASERSVWVVGASKAESPRYPIIRMWHGEIVPRFAVPRPSRLLPPISGDVVQAAADKEALHLLFSDLSVRDYLPDRGGVAGARWRDLSEEPPIAWGGDPTEPVVWALAHTAQLEAAPAHPASQATTAENPMVALLPDSRLAVLKLHNGRWRVVGAPKIVEEGDRFWIVGCRGQAWLFWMVAGEGVYAVSGSAAGDAGERSRKTEEQLEDEDRESELPVGASVSFPSTSSSLTSRDDRSSPGPVVWSAAEKVCEAVDLVGGWAGTGVAGPAFVAGSGADETRVQLHLYAREGGSWSEQGAAREGTELLELDSRTCGVCIASGRLLVARPVAEKSVEVGVGDPGPSPSVRFFALPLASDAAPDSSGWRDTIFLALVLVLMTVVMWTRREQMIRPLVLPLGLVLAPVWRRLLATVVDAMPAVVVVMPFVISAMPPAPWIFDPSFRGGVNLDAEVWDKLSSIYFGFVLLYGLWCLLWELLLGTTPGKLLFGCRVLTTDIGRPSARQIVWRNALRVLEVGFGTSGWIVTLMMLVMLTRNRQRIGDLLAGTIVVMLGPVEPERLRDQDADHRPPPSS